MWEILAEILDGSQCILQRIVQKISSEVEIFCNVNLAGESSRWVAWKKEPPPPSQVVHFQISSPEAVEVTDQPGMITWEGKFGPDDSVEVDLTVPWAWASAPNGMSHSFQEVFPQHTI